LGEVAALAGSLAWFGQAPLGAVTAPIRETRPKALPVPDQRTRRNVLGAIHHH